MKFSSGIVIFLVQILFTAQAQRICATTQYTQKVLTSIPSVQRDYDKAEAQIVAVTSGGMSAARDTTSNEIIYIPVVIHILYNTADQNLSDAQIQSQLTVLNNDYSGTNADRINTPAVFAPLAADTRIRFCLAQVDPQGNKMVAIIRKHTNARSYSPEDAMKFSAQGGDDAWDSKHYLNIWVCKMSGTTLGYSSLPGSPANVDGVVISNDVFGTVGNLRAPFNKGRTATHEIGHWLGLKHVWGDALCGSDEVDDTPTQQNYNYGCPTFPHVGTCSPNANGDMFMNFMDFTDDGCMNMFTNGQKRRMRALFAENNLRNSFLVSFACDSSLAQSGTKPVTKPDTLAVSPVTSFTVKIFPSPATSAITVQCKSASAAAIKRVNIFNVVGSKVFTGQLNTYNTIIAIDKLSKGIYIVSVEDGTTTATTKIVKE